MTHGPALIDAIRGEKAEPPPGIKTLGLDAAHRWISRLEGGEVDMTWAFDPAYTNTEGAVLCSWTTALADQALFFAATSLCLPGEKTRMALLSLVCLENIISGPVTIAARVPGRFADRMTGTCTFTPPDGVIAAVVTAVIDVVRE